jgi:oligoribonuclease NrnB/cAMP/cGMP phosphodiesterase (DHH superfamily)
MYKDYDKEIAGLRYDGIAGCMLAYIYLQLMTRLDGKVDTEFSPDLAKSAPWFTKLIADYDVWTFEYGDDTRYFEKGFSLVSHEPQDEIWSILLTENSLFKNRFRGTSYENDYPSRIKQFIRKGQTITAYRHNYMKDYCEKKGFETDALGYKAYAVNMALMGTDDFVIPNINDYDLLVSFSYDGKAWNYSLRSEKIDCAELAAKFGGGGHKGAAGFSTETLIL